MQAAEAAVHADSHALKILDALQSLPWCRIDVCFSGARMPFSHNHIQAWQSSAFMYSASLVAALTQLSGYISG